MSSQAAIAGSPAALRAKGIDDDAPPLTYTGPSEDGSAQVQRAGGAEARRTDGPAGVSGVKPRVSRPRPPRTAAGASSRRLRLAAYSRSAGQRSASGHRHVRSAPRWPGHGSPGYTSRTPRPGFVVTVDHAHPDPSQRRGGVRAALASAR